MQGCSNVYTTASGAQACETAELFEVPEEFTSRIRVQTANDSSLFEEH